MRLIPLLLAAALAAGPVRAQDPDPPLDVNDLVNALLGGLMGLRPVTEAELQQQVADAGGIAFRSKVPVDFMDRGELSRYLKDLFDSEYPPARAAADERTLVAFDLLQAGVDLRRLREKLLEDNIVGFYDERPGKKRLYAVSQDRSLTPANQLILAHELRHAMQDQYMDVQSVMPDSIGDFDDRRMALVSLLEGDATFVMERFLFSRVPGLEAREQDFAGLALPEAALPDVPPVLRDQLVRPYMDGRDFARAVFQSGGWDGMRAAWAKPPASSEQILHPDKFAAHESPREVQIGYVPTGGQLISEGVLGEMLIRTLLDGDVAAAAGWGGDRYQVWDVAGHTLLAWRTEWDTPADAREFLDAARARFTRTHGPGHPLDAWVLYGRGSWTVALAALDGGAALLASDDSGVLSKALRGVR